ncbi:ABC transporter ATP-binding protein [Pollutimonas harenae]|uniref:ABC transporter ATP-binding protein n=1 Tax=Pollutimonas harenae TaxID=657015 RepID=A0A853H9U7_9BURK|nr:ABC transporter ATP-binding protein [Pollutimonas harenae]NYT86804.1 ABC transporter ATP-binding protein [Pollutimonas harenae]TEA71450.1 ABC transporter ATP-binding protein [Pollutimonas harenae]
MQLTLDGISKKVGSETWLYEMSLSPQPGAVTVLLGATRSGKTSLMRVMAGLDAPTTGKVMVDGRDVTGQPVRKRNVAMVYQQFINYPSLTVRQNIASPLKLRGEKNVDENVHALAVKLHIDMFLNRLPAELSGGQQQRVALARALAKNAPLMLLDEPLVNLDYKLREELREELGQVFRSSDSTVIYATTEPAEALLLGGYTAVLDQGRLLQYGPATEVFHLPKSLSVARAYSDPPMNFVTATPAPGGVQLPDAALLSLTWPTGAVAAQQTVTVGLRASSLRLQAQEGDHVLRGKVLLAEISGSDTYVHVSSDIGEVVAQAPGVHHFNIGDALTLYFSPAAAFLFNHDGDLVMAPRLAKGA